jgi:flagellar biosynthesis protein FliR
VPKEFQIPLAMVIGTVIGFSGVKAAAPQNLIEGLMMVSTEFLLGYVLAVVPAFIIGGLTVAGQVTSAAIGLSQANMIDQSLGGNFSVIAKAQAMFATIVFLLIDGHHIIIKAATQVNDKMALGLYRPGIDTATILLDRFVESFLLAVTVAGPILVTVLVAQFVLGLITKFVPQVNIFIISLPLTIFVGLYIIGFTFPGLVYHLIDAYKILEEASYRILMDR